jgi:hypothetical protein
LTEGQGVLTTYYEGNLNQRYEGGMVAGRLHGKGVETYPGVKLIEGEFKNNKLDGRGMDHDLINNIKIIGTFKDGNCVKVTVYDKGKKFSGKCSAAYPSAPPSYYAYIEKKMARKEQQESLREGNQTSGSQQRQSGRGGLKELRYLEVTGAYSAICNDDSWHTVHPEDSGNYTSEGNVNKNPTIVGNNVCK